MRSAGDRGVASAFPLLLPLLLSMQGGAGGGELQAAEAAVQRASQASRPAVLTVVTPEPNDADQTGALVAPGLAITVRRGLVVNGALPEEVEVRMPGAGPARAKVVADDAATDTLLLALPGAKASPLPPMPAEEVLPGLWVLLLGNTFGEGRESTPSVALGIVSRIERSGEEIRTLGASALINPGSAGAPLLDLSGRLVGIAAGTIFPSTGQTVVIPWESVRRAYAAQGGAVARAIDRPMGARSRSPTVGDAMAAAVGEAARRGGAAIVGVRSGETLEAPPPAPPGNPPGSQGPPMPAPVPGRLPGSDRSSGLVVGGDGWILCPIRVTGWPGPARALAVDLPDGRTLPANRVGVDERLRVALLKAEATGLPTLEPAPEASRTRGHFAVALGHPHESELRGLPQISIGVISRSGALGQLHPAFRAIQTDAAVGGGNRGGALVDLEGRLLGMVLDVNDTEDVGYLHRIRGRYGGNCGLGFALPPETIAAILPLLQAGRTLRSPMLGVSLEPAAGGLRVAAVHEKNSLGEPTTAAGAGLKPGDVVVAVAGREVRRIEDLRQALGELFAGDTAEIVFLRDGQRNAIRALLSAP